MTEFSRRNVLGAGASAATVLIAGSVLTVFSSKEVAAAGLTAQDVSVSSNDGNLSTLTITPDITVNWEGQEAAVAEVQTTWYVKTASTSEVAVGNTPFTISVSSPSKSGSVSNTFSEISLLSNNGGALSGSNFDAATDGGSKSTDVTLSMDLTLKDSGGNTLASVTDALGPKTYIVTVGNATSSVSSSGTANTGGS